MRGATIIIIYDICIWRFQSTRPMRGATSTCNGSYIALLVSIHAPHAGRDANDALLPVDEFVSIHAPHAGRDNEEDTAPIPFTGFNPRAPCGARLSTESVLTSPMCFNPRAPCGARRLGSNRLLMFHVFQSTRPMRGATPYAYTCGIYGWFQSTRPMRGAT